LLPLTGQGFLSEDNDGMTLRIGTSSSSERTDRRFDTTVHSRSIFIIFRLAYSTWCCSFYANQALSRGDQRLFLVKS